MGHGQSVAIKGFHGQYITASSSGKVRADQYERDEDETFELHFINNTEVAFRSFYNKWLCVESSGEVVCDRDYRADWEAFSLLPSSKGKFAFKSYFGKFLSAQPDGYLTAENSVIGDCEMFDIEIMDLDNGHVSILGAHGKYLSVEQDGKVLANREKCPIKSEAFDKVVISPCQVAFRSNVNNKWLGTELDGRIVCKEEKRGKAEIFYIHPAPNSRFSLRSSHGKFLCLEPDGKILANREIPLEWEYFAIQSL